MINDDNLKSCPFCGAQVEPFSYICSRCGRDLGSYSSSNIGTGAPLDNLNVDLAWKKRFLVIQEYFEEGRLWKPNAKFNTSNNKQEILSKIYFNDDAMISTLCAAIFGPVYYLYKGMIKNAILYLIAWGLVTILTMGAGGIFFFIGFGALAPFDYYRFKVLNQT